MARKNLFFVVTVREKGKTGKGEKIDLDKNDRKDMIDSGKYYQPSYGLYIERGIPDRPRWKNRGIPE